MTTPSVAPGSLECPETDTPTPTPVIALAPEIHSFIETQCSSAAAQLGASPALEKAPPQLILEKASAKATFGAPFSPILRHMVAQAKRQLPPPPPSLDISQPQQHRQRSTSLKRVHDDGDDISALTANAPKRNLSVGRGPNPDDSIVDYWNERNMLLFQQKTQRGRSVTRGNKRGGK